ncbi:LysR substrate-binding domain-containing protein [Bradyrhizobium canariense]|uniref:LysR family transcriptional regulator, glycine cleavage system transcriptional activator n=1 Tax=Bradyrhizobium canariense TaxID=255045 RepID=A0A1H1ZNR7_9BRAD|nr:LysR substrate-binding domain-containing protein [Bradyrhizobium canariense]SDT35344.1 LysR family transcriptional regulator, glycine cleavage system transcriptional activator [Bradyrhizobium canariense]
MALPSLRNLQVFEVAARHPTLRAAADALFLTHGAVSRQIRALEAELGVALFTRTKRGMVLTPQGQQLQATVAEALKLMSDAAVTLGRDATNSSARLTVTVLPSFATRWLLPRLSDFQSRHPDIAVELISVMAPLDLTKKKIHLGIRNGEGKWAGVTSERLAQEKLFPVAAKNGIVGYDRLPHSAQELLEYPLLNPYDDWQRWFGRAGVTARLPLAGKTFDDANLLLQAAEAGEGVALGRKWLVADALDKGTLVRLSGPMITSLRSYYLIYPENQPLSPHAEAFAIWIRERMNDG